MPGRRNEEPNGTADGPGPLNRAQSATLRAATARLVPSDDTPGAEEAAVVRYIERALEADYAADLPAYIAGLAALDDRARRDHGSAFADLSAAAQDRLLAAIEAEGDAFFETLIVHTVEGMFGDPRWGGNAGRAGWALLGYEGPRLAWSASDQGIRA